MMVLEQFTENLDETAKARQEARGILSKFNTLHLTLCHYEKVSPDNHNAAEHKYGCERSPETLKVIE